MLRYRTNSFVWSPPPWTCSAMPPVSPSSFLSPLNSVNFTPLIQVTMLGGLPVIRARSSFHCPCFQNFGHSFGETSSGVLPRFGVATISLGLLPNEKLRDSKPPRPSPYTPIRL